MTIIENLPLDLFGTDTPQSSTLPTTDTLALEGIDTPQQSEACPFISPEAEAAALPPLTSDPLAVPVEYETEPETVVIEEEEVEKAFYTEEEAEQVAIDNEKLVYYVANRFRSTGIGVEELSSVGFLGYAKAIKTYDKNRNVKFSTYAINVIKNEICYFLRKESKHMRKNVSLNTILSTDQNGNPFELSDIIDDEDIPPLDEDIMISDRRDMLYEVIQRLTPKEQYIIMNRFELAGNEKKTQKQISEEINMSQANVSKLQKNAIRKLEFYLQLNMKDRNLTLDKALEM